MLSSVVGMTQAAETPTTPSRASRIAAIYAFGHWLVEHPEVPAPTSITAMHHSYPADEADEATRFAAVDALARAFGTEMYPQDKPSQFTHEVIPHETGGCGVFYTGAYVSDAAYGKNL